MNKEQAWKNFDLGEEISVSGAFIYDGLRGFHAMKTLENTDEVFQFLYNTSVGLERLLKVTVTLLEHGGALSQEEFEKSLITHNHLELLRRVRKHASVRIAGPHKELLALSGGFYKTQRYDRFSLSRVWDPSREKAELKRFLEKRLDITFEGEASLFPTRIDARIRRYIGGLVSKLCGELYEVVRQKAQELNLYTYELRSSSKAERVFLGECDFATDEILWKELLVYFMNTRSDSGLLAFLRSIEPLDFDEGLAPEYLQCFESEEARAEAMGELEELYASLEDPGERKQIMSVIGDPSAYFNTDYEEDHDETEGDQQEGG